MSDATPKPIFVVGMNGSGTTMLAECLGRHPEIYMFPQESYVLPHYINKSRSYGDLGQLMVRRKLAQDLTGHTAYWLVNGKSNVKVPDEFLSEPGIAGVIDGVYRYFSAKAAKHGVLHWGDKTPMYIQHVELLANTFNNAKFIHIYRDGRDIAQSLHRRWRFNPCRSIYRWRETMQTAKELRASFGEEKFYEVSYEQLTEKPESNLRDICLFLELPFNTSILKSAMPHMDKIAANDMEKFVRNSGKWKSYFSSEDIVRLEAIAGKMLRERGYEVMTDAGNNSPGGLRRLVWIVHDRAQSVIIAYRTFGFAFLKNAARRVRDSLIQSKTSRY